MTTDHVVSRDGTKIAYEYAGTGPAVILVEPSGHYRDLSAFEDLRPMLTNQLTVYAYDRRGRGDSGDASDYEPDREVEDLRALIDRIGEPTHLYGYSSGALLALRAAAAGVPIVSMALLEPPLQPPNAAPDPLTGELASLVAAGRFDDAVEHFHRSIGVPDEVVHELRGSPTSQKMAQIAHTLVYDCRISDTTTPALLATVHVPTLVLDSTGSTDDLASWAAQVASQIHGATHRSLPGSWHRVDDDILAQTLLGYFAP